LLIGVFHFLEWNRDYYFEYFDARVPKSSSKESYL